MASNAEMIYQLPQKYQQRMKTYNVSKIIHSCVKRMKPLINVNVWQT